MKCIAFATGLAFACATALANQPTDAPKHKCEPKPKIPGVQMMKDRSVRLGFDRDLKAYKECMNAYLDERNVVIKVNQDAANAAINEYNGVMKELIEAQAAK